MIVIVQYVRQLYCYRNPAIYSDPVWAVRTNDQLFGKERTCANLRLLSQKLETQYPYIQTKKRTWLNPLSSSRYLFIVFYRVPIFPFGCCKLLGKVKIPCSGYKSEQLTNLLDLRLILQSLNLASHLFLIFKYIIHGCNSKAVKFRCYCFIFEKTCWDLQYKIA